MDNILNVLTAEEKISLSLRALYNENGYSQYRMSKFEEYDLYVKNKDFLVSSNVLTFTDTNGKLLALKPDVTLSIIKNSRDIDGVMKVYYNENVYRVSKGTKSFKEIMQAGLECIGAVDNTVINEVLTLACKSLDLISKNNILVISHLDIISGVLDYCGLNINDKKQVVKLLGEKNVFAIKQLCEDLQLSKENSILVQKLVTVYGTPEKVADAMRDFAVNVQTGKAIAELNEAITALNNAGFKDKIIIDFSVVNDMKYYNGISFKGFIEGVPTGILSGGQYDNLMAKMDKKYQAIGFAVYLDELSRIGG
ncbi:MAG: ATP phosphoribosyltransferase regulatory subunit [Clostridia bacterium]|nr:ATP phosphoribosyltransferase regulatory subunit [Clostridia bacterium]